MPDSIVRSCVLGIHYASNPDAPEFFQVDGKMVLFDTLAQAQGFIERMGGGRPFNWSADHETIYFHPRVDDGYNAISIWTGYDPYDVNTGFIMKGVRSEAKFLDWRYHIHYHEVWKKMLAFADSNSVSALEKLSGNMDQSLVEA